MKRKKQIIIFLVLIPLLAFSFCRLGGYYFQAADVLYAYERGLQYGPSKKIVEEYSSDGGGKVVVGVGEDFLTVIETRRAFGILWKYERGGGYDIQSEMKGFIRDDGKAFGLSRLEDVTVVYGLFEGEDGTVTEMTFPVDEDGYFSAEVQVNMEEERVMRFDYIEGFDEEGQRLYRWGRDLDGNLFYDEKT